VSNGPGKKSAPAAFASQGKAGPHDDQANHPADAARHKAAVTAAAEFALLGWALTENADGGFTATRWDRSRRMGDLAEVRAFLRQIGGAR
jgi:hypothetical protein